MKTSNDGFQIINPIKRNHSEYCVVVVGVARGGTSAVAASLRGLGIHMGDQINPANQEDRKIISSIPSKGKTLLNPNAWNNFSAVAKEYTEAHQYWGFKYPSIHNHLYKINKLLVNPRYIFVFRDIFAISSRRSGVFPDDSQIGSMQNSLRLYKKILEFTQKEHPTSFLVSYEKILTNTEAYINALSEFCNLSPTTETLKQAANLIMPSPDTYERWTQNHKQALDMNATSFRGRVHKADRRTVNGWATNLKNNDPVTVDIYINNELHGHSLCHKKRPRLFENGTTNSPNVGFNYSFADPPPDADAIVKVVIAGANIELVNSGKGLREY